MIVKGKSRSNGVQLGAYLLSMEVNEEVRVLDISGMATRDLTQALIEMQEITDRGQRGVKGLYHAVISPQPGYQMTEEQWLYAADALGLQLKLDHQPRAIVLHEKNDGQGGTRVHAHVVFQRTDKERLSLIPDSWNYIAHERAARHLEEKFGHEIVPGKHAEPRSKERDRESIPDHERHQEDKAGLSKQERIAKVTELFRQSDGAKSFAASLAHAGYTLAKGDRRDFVILDNVGQVYSLPRCIEGVKTKELRKFFEPLNASKMPSVDEAKSLIRDKLASDKSKKVEKEKAKTEFTEAASDKARSKNKHPGETKKRDDASQKIPQPDKEAMRGRAKKAFELASASNGLERYAKALGERLRASAGIAQTIRTRLGKTYDAIASRVSEKWQSLKSKLGTSQGKGGNQGQRELAPQSESASKTFNKAAKALKAVEKASRDEQARKGPSNDR